MQSEGSEATRTAASTAAPAPPSAPQESATLISSTILEVENQRFVDLDSGAQAVGDTFDPPVGSDLSFGNVGRIQPVRPSRMHQILSNSVEQCSESISVDENGIREVFGDELRVGDLLCVATSDRNIAVLQVTQVPIGKYFEGGMKFEQDLYQVA